MSDVYLEIEQRDNKGPTFFVFDAQHMSSRNPCHGKGVLSNYMVRRVYAVSNSILAQLWRGSLGPVRTLEALSVLAAVQLPQNWSHRVCVLASEPQRGFR